MIVLGLFPKIGALAQIIPEPVLGGGMLVMFGMVAVQGIRMLLEVDFSNDKNLLIVAVSVGWAGFQCYADIIQSNAANIANVHWKWHRNE